MEEEEDDGTPWKGKSADFFVMKPNNELPDDAANPFKFELNDKQWNFVFKFYPGYATAPYEILTWVYE